MIAMDELEITSTHDAVVSAETLLRCNETYYQLFMSKPFCKMISSGILAKNEKKREKFFNLMQIFTNYFQTMIQMRQATCRDNKFYFTFLAHFSEEIGHDDLLRKRESAKEVWDPILVAVSTWFVHQMQVLDNIEKAAVMHLVLEKAGDYYHSIGNNAFNNRTESNYYAIHAKHDEDHSKMIMDLLPGYPEFTYQRLHHVLKESWLMLYAMIDRVHELMMQE